MRAWWAIRVLRAGRRRREVEEGVEEGRGRAEARAVRQRRGLWGGFGPELLGGGGEEAFEEEQEEGGRGQADRVVGRRLRVGGRGALGCVWLWKMTDDADIGHPFNPLPLVVVRCCVCCCCHHQLRSTVMETSHLMIHLIASKRARRRRVCLQVLKSEPEARCEQHAQFIHALTNG